MLDACLNHRPAHDLEVIVGRQQIEVLHPVAEAVGVSADRSLRAHLEAVAEHSLAHLVGWPKPDLGMGLADRGAVPVSSGVSDLEAQISC